MKRFPRFTAYGYRYRPVVVDPPVDPVPVGYTWDDVFADYSAHAEIGGADWTGWGTSPEEPAQVPLEWFMRNILRLEAPDGAVITLESPTGAMFLTDRMQPPPRSVAKNWTLDLMDTGVERGKAARNWGQLHLWGVFVEDPTVPSEGVVSQPVNIGATSLVLGTGEGSAAFLNAVQPGAVVEVRTNATALDYHPAESRTTVFVTGKDVGTRTISIALPLDITVPVNNPTGDFEGEVSDPSTLKLLVGALLTQNANAGENFIRMASTANLAPGDWLNIQTIEVPAINGCQFLDGVGDNDFAVDPLEDFGLNPIQCNEELHQIQSISGDVVTLTQPLGKNKLLAWQACAVKVDPIEGATVMGGVWNGFMDNAGARAWDHQYIWGRYMVDCTVAGGVYDNDLEREASVKRIGQAVRLDTGHGNIVENLTIFAGGSIEAGEGYGISLRRGERNTVARHNWITGCRHSIEFWGTSGGCVALANICEDDTSSSIDTHGSWNVGVRIEENTIRRSAEAFLSSDTSGWPDAIRIGNNKFVWDEDIEVLNNSVVDYEGAAISIVPGARRVTVDGLSVTNAQRIVRLTQNSRHDDVAAEDVVIRNVVANTIKDRLTEISHAVAGKVVCKGLTLENWTVGASGEGTVDNGLTRNIRVLDCEDVRLDTIDLGGIATVADQYSWWFEDIAGLTLSDLRQDGGERGISIRNVTGVSGDATILNLTDAAGTAYLVRADGTNSGSLTITHNQSVPAVQSTGVDVTLLGAL